MRFGPKVNTPLPTQWSKLSKDEMGEGVGQGILSVGSIF